MTYSPTTIANYFIKSKASLGKLTPMKILKLTYLSYAWYLTLNNGKDTLFREQPEAWQYGPVFRSLYNSMKQYGSIEIYSPLPNNTEETITQEDAKFLERIWEIYGKFSGVELSALTHKPDSPWSQTYKKGCNVIIPDAVILDHYKKHLLKPKN